MSFLKQSSTSTIKVGPILSATDLSALTSATLTVKLSKNGGTLAVRNSSTAITHDADGNYNVELDATDTGTCGELTVDVTATGAIPWTKTYSVINELAYTELMGSKYDAIMLREALRQGFDPSRDAIVLWADTDADRGTNLKTAVAAVGALTPTASAWGRVWIPPWHYDVGSTSLALDTNYVELRALYPERGGERHPNDLDDSSGETSLSSFRPPKTLVYTDDNNVNTVNQSVTSVSMYGFGVAQLSGYADGAYSAYYVSADTNAGSVYRAMYFWHKAPISSRGSGVFFYKHVSGVWIDCTANAYAWRVGRSTADGIFSARMSNCHGGYASFIGDYLASPGEGNRKASGCDLRKCSVVGRWLNITYTFSGAGFGGCAMFGVKIDSSCYFEDCQSGDNSFGIGNLNEGIYIRCRGGKYSFGCTTYTSDDTYTGTFAGYAEDCYAETGSFGGRGAGVGAWGLLSGTLVRCSIVGNVLPHRVEGATIIDTVMTMATADQPVVTLLDSASKIHNSTLLPVEGGTGVPIYAASALSVSAAGNTYGNKSAAANGLGAGITNLATIDVVPKVDLTTAATSVTNAVTTDSASREASKADVSTLATSTELAASKTILDKFDSMIAEDS